jgi:hypothetical protein
MNEKMKNILNRFALWLFEKTQPEQPFDVEMLWRGKKLIVSNYLPEDTILVGSKNWKEMRYAFLNQKITLHKKTENNQHE